MLHPFNLRLLLHKLFLNAYCPLHHCFLSHSGSLITVTFICLFSFIAACNSSVLPPLCALSFFPQLRYYTLLSICFFSYLCESHCFTCTLHSQPPPGQSVRQTPGVCGSLAVTAVSKTTAGCGGKRWDSVGCGWLHPRALL